MRALHRRGLPQARSRAACDLLLTPTTPTPAFKAGEKTDDPVAMYLADIFVCAVNLAGLPAMSLPSGRSRGCRSARQLIAPDVRGGANARRGRARSSGVVDAAAEVR